ncbi:M15 family metallopeptidase [Polyangium sp. 6x1]|uniref:M15 family metallopeptidase n=1 Tax=Polyangium sp. 6x1 TaxID=3042689 RepID=UPI002482D3AD|nr:M15 family metallopeptidase [Polyangium sp. 6x1]MDI1445328.1 M15 family metallopeptidase [Polyangium sp. 6x1]
METPEPTDTNDEAVSGSTVSQAAASSCATSSVKGLSLQIIEEARCLNPDAYVAITKTSNVTFGSSVFAYLEKPARDRLVAALKENPGKSMTINSALRTVAQQYMLYNWYQNGRCGISLAAKPGASNHETGLALDVSQYSTWKTILTNKGFKWLGSSDAVHFDYAGSGAVSYKGLDVKAFQRLWNRNNPGDTISVDGAWGPQTEARMKKSPAGGFAKGATCGSAIMYDGADDAAEAFSRDPNDPEFFVPLPIDAVEAQPELEHEACSDHAH